MPSDVFSAHALDHAPRGKDGQRVLRGGYAHLYVGIGGDAADVRAEHDPLLVMERMRDGHRLDGEAVESGAGDLARSHGIAKGRLVDQATACGVDDDHASLARRQGLRIDQLGVVGRQRAVQRDGIRLAPDRRQVDRLDVRRQILGVRVEAEHAHAHGVGDPGEAKSDRAQSDHADDTPFELDALVGRLVPVPRAHALVERDDRLGAGEQQRDGLFSDGGRVRADRGDDLDAACLRRDLVDGVGAAAVLRDHLQARCGSHRRRADLAVADDDRHRIVPLAERDDVVLGRRLAGEHHVEVRQQGERLRREVGARDEKAGLAAHSFLSVLQTPAGAQRAVEPRGRERLAALDAGDALRLGGQLLGGQRQQRRGTRALDDEYAVGVPDHEVAGADRDAADGDRMVQPAGNELRRSRSG
jgi:hypothetical protein